MSQQAILMGIPWRPILVASADFDGSADYMTRGAGLTNAANGKTGILSLWFRLDGGNGATSRFLTSASSLAGAADTVRFSRFSSDKIVLTAFPSPGGVANLTMFSTTSYTASATWHHLLASWDLANTTGQLYVDDADDLAAGGTYTDSEIDYTCADWAIGGDPDGSDLLSACLTEFYFAPNQHLDFSTESNRRKFRTSTGLPMYLGEDGSLPTGTAPLVYQRVALGAAVATFATNRGSGGDFAITGTLATGSTSPSD